MRVVIIYPQVAEAIAKYQEERKLPLTSVRELQFGLDEVMQVVNLFNAQPDTSAELLAGEQATIHGLLAILASPVDVLWILTHGIEQGWFLKDGLVNASETTALIRSAGVFLTVMNSCSSYQVAHQAAEELGTAFVCTITEVPDRQAFITGVLFARHLASGTDYRTAWEKSKPGQKHPFILLEARGEMTPVDRGAPRSQQSDDATFKRFLESVEELERIVYGHPRLGVPPLRDSVNSLQSEFRKIRDEELKPIKDKLDEITRKQEERDNTKRERNILLFGMAIVIFVLLLIVAVLVFQPRIGFLP